MTNTNICSDCISEIHLKQLVENYNIIDYCNFCKTSGNIIDYESDNFYYLIKALIRYHFDEWEYNDHWGGDSLYKLIENNNIFFNQGNFNDSNDLDILTELIENFEAYEDNKKGISLYAGYDEDGNQNTLLRALKKEFHPELLKIDRELKFQNYFEFEDTIIEKFEEFKDIARTSIDNNQIFYRARVGYSKREYDYLDGHLEINYIYSPYSNKEISSPPPSKSESGRLNRVGVSFLYCATNEYTAISEIRPHPGDKVSIGTFKPKEKLIIFDSTKIFLFNYYKNDELLDEYFLYINSVNKLFQKHIPPSKRDNYSITQLIADSIRKLGFDGILFNSSIGEGKNLVIFNPKKMTYTELDMNIILVSEVSYEYSTLKQ